MGLVKTRRLAVMQKQQRAKVEMRMKSLPKVTSGKGVRQTGFTVGSSGSPFGTYITIPCRDRVNNTRYELIK